MDCGAVGVVRGDLGLDRVAFSALSAKGYKAACEIAPEGLEACRMD